GQVSRHGCPEGGLFARVRDAVLAGWAGVLNRALRVHLCFRLADALITVIEAVVDELALLWGGARVVAVAIRHAHLDASPGDGRPAACGGRRVGDASTGARVADLT